MKFKELLPTILMVVLLGSAGLYVHIWGNSEKVFWGGFAAMLFFYALTFFMGSYVARSQSGKIQGSDAMLAGRTIPLWISVFTMSATWLGGGYINGSAEITYTSGLMYLQAPWGYALSLILGGLFFAKIMRKYQFKTMLDPMQQKFGERVTALLFIPALVGELFWTAAILSALGSTFGIVIGLDFEVSIILSAVVAIAYTALGGLWAVALTDVVQLILLFAGLIIITPFILDSAGGWSEAWARYCADTKLGVAATFLPDTTVLGSRYWQWWDGAFLLVLGGIPWQSYFQRVLAARSDRAAVNLSVLSGFVCLIAVIPPVMIGVVGAVTDWSQYGGAPANSLDILPYAIKYLTPALVAMVGLGAVAAAVMSSVDSSILSAASMATWNVYRPLINPKVEAKKLGKMIQISVWVLGIAATLIALQVKSIYVLWFLCSDFVYCLLFPALVCALFDKKANWYGALAGFFVAFLLRFGGGDASLGIPVFLPYPVIDAAVELAADGSRILVLLPYKTIAMVSGILSIMLVSRLTQKAAPANELTIVGD